MFMLLAAIPALIFAWSLGGRFAGLIEHRWRHVWLIWAGLGVQLVLFTPLGNGIPHDTLKVAHVATYLPIVAFLALNRDAGLGIIAAGVSLNLLAIGVNGGLMPADPIAQEVFFTEEAGPGHPINTDASAERLLLFGDVMALPPWFPFANAFSIGDFLLALGLCWALARLTVPGRETPPPVVSRLGAIRLLTNAARRLGPWMVAGAGVGYGAASEPGLAAAAVIALLLGRASRWFAPRMSSPWALSVTAVAIPFAGLLVEPASTLALLTASAAAGVLLGPGPGVRRGDTETAGLERIAALASAALGLAVGASLAGTVGLAGALVVAGAVIVAVAFAADLPWDVEEDALPAATTLVREHLPRLALPGLGAAALGATAAAATRLPLPVPMGSERFGLVAAAVAAGTVCGLLMASRLTAGPNARALGVGVLFAGASIGLAASARNPMTLIIAAVVLGISAGGAAWLIRNGIPDALRRRAWVPSAVGAAAGMLVPVTSANTFMWAVAACAAIAGFTTVARSFRPGTLAMEPAAT